MKTPKCWHQPPHTCTYICTHSHRDAYISYTLLHTPQSQKPSILLLDCFVSSMRWELRFTFPCRYLLAATLGLKDFSRYQIILVALVKINWLYKCKSAFRLTIITDNGFSICFIHYYLAWTPKLHSLFLDLCDITAVLEMESHKSLAFIPLAIQSPLPVFHFYVLCVWHMHVRVCRFTPMCRAEQDVRCLPPSCSTFWYWDQISLTWKPFWLDWLVRKRQRSACFHSPPRCWTYSPVATPTHGPCRFKLQSSCLQIKNS